METDQAMNQAFLTIKTLNLPDVLWLRLVLNRCYTYLSNMRKLAFAIEHKRAELAAAGKLKELRKLYSSKYPEIKDENTSSFWNERYEQRTPLAEKDGMTRDRVRIAASFLPSSAMDILDIGMGDGWLEEEFESKDLPTRYMNVFGNDISDVTIERLHLRFADRFLSCAFTVESLYKMRYQKDMFDAVFLLEVLEHVPPSKTFKLLKDIHEFLKPDGCLILSVPTNEGLESMSSNPNSHVRMYTVPLITTELKLAGFTVQQIKTIYAFSSYYRLKKLLMRVWRNHWRPNNIIIQACKTNL